MEQYGLKIIWTARYDYNPCQCLKNHKHSYYQMIYFIDGHGVFLYDSQRLAFDSGDIFFIKPGTVHGFINDTSSAYKTLDIKFHIEDDALIELCHELNPHYKKISMVIVSLFEKTMAEGMVKKEYYKIFADTYLLQIIYSLLRATCKAQVSEDTIPFVVPDGKYGATAQIVKQYIETHFAEPLTVSGIANQVGYSESYTNKIFREVFQCGIPFYLKILRIEKSKELISYSEYALKQIASLVGFKNVHHFSRVFKKVVGIPPGQWHNTEKDRIRKDIYFE